MAILILSISLLGIAIQSLYICRRTKRLSMTDALTGLYNRGYFEEYLEQAHPGQYLSLIMVDLEYFKRYNDTYGHPAGDMVLKGLGQSLRRNTRRGDLVARYGGEEFIIILPITDKGQAVGLAEKIRREVESRSFNGNGGVTISAGVASFPEDDSKGVDLVEKAHWALYEAKKEGRNRVCPFLGRQRWQQK